MGIGKVQRGPNNGTEWSSQGIQVGPRPKQLEVEVRFRDEIW